MMMKSAPATRNSRVKVIGLRAGYGQVVIGHPRYNWLLATDVPGDERSAIRHQPSATCTASTVRVCRCKRVFARAALAAHFEMEVHVWVSTRKSTPISCWNP